MVYLLKHAVFLELAFNYLWLTKGKKIIDKQVFL